MPQAEKSLFLNLNPYPVKPGSNEYLFQDNDITKTETTSWQKIKLDTYSAQPSKCRCIFVLVITKITKFLSFIHKRLRKI